MAQRGRKPLQRAKATCTGRHYDQDVKFDLTITRDGMAGYGYCESGHWNLKFLRPPEELLYLYMTKMKLSGSLTGIEGKILNEAFYRWAEAKKAEVSHYGSNQISVTLKSKIVTKHSDLAMMPCILDAYHSYPPKHSLINNRDEEIRNLTKELEQLSGKMQRYSGIETFTVRNHLDIQAAIPKIKAWAASEPVNIDEEYKSINTRVYEINMRVMEIMKATLEAL